MRDRRGLWLGAVLILGVLSFAPASAEHGLYAEHRPPPIARAGEPLDLHVAVASTCETSCGQIAAVAWFLRPDGGTGEVRAELSARAGVLTLTIGGNDVRGCCYGLGRLTYWIEVEQLGGDQMHRARVRLPVRASHEVWVIG